jgi:hypothetical protein
VTEDRRRGSLQRGVGRVEPLAPEHETEARRMHQRVVEIGDPVGHEPLVGARLRGVHVGAGEHLELVEALRREGGQQPAQISEVMGGRTV